MFGKKVEPWFEEFAKCAREKRPVKIFLSWTKSHDQLDLLVRTSQKEAIA